MATIPQQLAVRAARFGAPASQLRLGAQDIVAGARKAPPAPATGFPAANPIGALLTAFAGVPRTTAPVVRKATIIPPMTLTQGLQALQTSLQSTSRST